MAGPVICASNTHLGENVRDLAGNSFCYRVFCRETRLELLCAVARRSAAVGSDFIEIIVESGQQLERLCVDIAGCAQLLVELVQEFTDTFAAQCLAPFRMNITVLEGT